MNLLPTLGLGMLAAMAPALSSAQEAMLPTGKAFRVELDSAARVRVGTRLAGHLTESVYLPDHEVIPSGTLITGTVLGSRPGGRREHIQRLLAADFTPPRIPEVVFTALSLPAQAGRPASIVAINAPGQITSAGVLTLGARKQRQSIRQRISATVAQGKDDICEITQKPRIREAVEKWAVGQLPYHPDILWSKTHFTADLSVPTPILDLPHPEVPIADLHGKLPSGTLTARLVTPLTSATAKHGDAVVALVDQPLFSADHSHVLVPEGTRMRGTVVQSKAARNLGRNGSLRFSFNKLDLPTVNTDAQSLPIHGHLSAAQTAPGQNVALDEEGEAKASDGPAKLAEPAVLAILAAAATPDDHDTGGANLGNATVTSNGFGLIARVVSLGTRNRGVVQGFAYFALAKSIYFRWLSKGHDITFDHDTEMRVTLAER